MSQVLDCASRFNQLVLFIVNIVVALLGLAVMIVGAWANADSRQYFKIADDSSEYTQVSVLLIVVGIFVLLIGLVGAVGALFARKVFGRIILIVYAISLGLLVICEISGGIAAAVAKNELENAFRDSANSTFSEYWSNPSEHDTWNEFQEKFECCGVEGYQDYSIQFGNESIPLSCCNDEKKGNDGRRINCTEITTNVTQQYVQDGYIYDKGCADAIVDAVRRNLGVIAGTAITLAIVQVIGIVMACFVAIYRPQKNYEVV